MLHGTSKHRRTSWGIPAAELGFTAAVTTIGAGPQHQLDVSKSLPDNSPWFHLQASHSFEPLKDDGGAKRIGQMRQEKETDLYELFGTHKPHQFM